MSKHISPTYTVLEVLTWNVGAFFARDDGNIFNCQMCSLRWCLTCDNPFHENQTCEQHLAPKQTEQEQRAAALKLKAEEDRARALAAECREQEEAVERRKGEEGATISATHPCPRCKVKIIRSDGCDHMTCMYCCISPLLQMLTIIIGRNKGCFYQFCWLCDAPYDGPYGVRTVGNSAHKNSCAHYR